MWLYQPDFVQASDYGTVYKNAEFNDTVGSTRWSPAEGASVYFVFNGNEGRGRIIFCKTFDFFDLADFMIKQKVYSSKDKYS
jgi:hypothetical protein